MDIRPRTPLISFCTVQLRTFWATHSLATLSLSTTSGPDPGELPGFWGSVVFRHAPILQKRSGKQQQQHHGMRKVFAKVLLMTLLEEQKQHQVNFCKGMLQKIKDDPDILAGSSQTIKR